MRVSSWGSKNLGRVGDESGAEAGLLQREVDELLVREAGAEATGAAAHFRFRAGTVVRGARGWELGWEETRRERQSWEKPHVHAYTGTFPFAPTSFRHGIFQQKNSFRHLFFF